MDTILEFLQNHSTFVLTTHVNPDGDAIGCEIALALWLRGRGKTVHVINHNATPFVYRFLDPENTIRTFNPSTDGALLNGVDAIILLDTNHLSRVVSMEPFIRVSRAAKACIDHHLDPEDFADVTWIRPEATSTGEILFDLFQDSGKETISTPIARALYVAIMTDTGSFRYPRVGAATHRMVASLIEAGADPVELYNEVYNRWSPGRLRLLGEMLSGIQTAYDGRLVYVTVTRDMLERNQASEEDTDNFTSYLMSMEGVQAGMFFLELARGFKVSFRSHGDIPINLLAREFGGNGHKNAAGARFTEGSLSVTRSAIVQAAEKYLTEKELAS
jgi:bifunctional oligoribonuclease and PAP phosphatase NrnA